MFTLLRRESFGQDIKKSRFRAVAGPVEDEAAARRFIAAESDASAGHNCWAFRLGALSRFSDDGEPGGTAGRPILQAIEGQQLDGVALVVSRWFGGVLLGTGGLVRAYGGTAAACLRMAEKQERIERIALTVTCAFAEAARIRARLAGVPAAEVEEERFTAEGACLRVLLPRAEAETFRRLVMDLTRGQALVEAPEEPGNTLA